MKSDISESNEIFKIPVLTMIIFYLIGLPFIFFGMLIFGQGIYIVFNNSNPLILLLSIPFGILTALPGIFLVLTPITAKIELFNEKLISYRIFRKHVISFNDIIDINYKVMRMPYGTERRVELYYKNGECKKFRLNLYSEDTCDQIIQILERHQISG